MKIRAIHQSAVHAVGLTVRRSLRSPCPLLKGRRAGAMPAKAWTDDALMALPRDGYKYELLDGQIIMSPAGFKHGDLCSKIIIAIGNFVQPRKLGRVCDGQTGFRLSRGFKRKTVLSPDVSFLSRERVETIKAPEKFVEGGPDLAVEVLSPGDSLPKTEKKVGRFFRNGTRLAWIIDPVARQAFVHRPRTAPVIVSAEQALEGGDVLPGFRLRLRKVLG